MVRHLTQLAPLLQRLASLDLGLDTANAAAGLVVLQQLHSLRRLKLSSSHPGRKLRLKFAALRLLPSSLTELHLHFKPALGDDPLANEFPTVCFPHLRRLVLHFAGVNDCVQEAEPFQATDALCPLLTWLEVIGPNPYMHQDSELEDLDWDPDMTEETFFAQLTPRFPAIQTLDLAEGYVKGYRFNALEQMPHLLAARLHLGVYTLCRDIASRDTVIMLPVLQHVQILQLKLRGVNEYYDREWWDTEPPKYDLSLVPNLKWAIIIEPYLHPPAAVPRSLSKLLLVSNNTHDDAFEFRCDLDILELLGLITKHEQCRVRSGCFLGPRLLLHEGESTSDAAFPSDIKWYTFMAQLSYLELCC